MFRFLGYAITGIVDGLITQKSLRIQVVALFIVLILGFIFKISPTEWCLILLSSGLVIASELMNTALEVLTDLVSPEFHPLAGRAKDIAAGAVLFGSIIAFIIGAIIFIPKLIALL